MEPENNTNQEPQSAPQSGDGLDAATCSVLLTKVEGILLAGYNIWNYRGGEWKIAKRVRGGAYVILAEGRTLRECLMLYTPNVKLSRR